jgi:preprotein translocase subunit SecG
MLYGFVIAIHVIVSLVLIAVILLQAGRGGGLSESFGGSSTQTIFGTKTNVFLMRATTASAIIYILTCLVLGVMTSHRGRSLVSSMPASQTGVPLQLPDMPDDF